ncbi:ribosome assembly factor SBDS [Candidatus Aenigmatarchaeota archaeon]
MVTVDEAIIAKLDKEGKHFEVLVDPQIAYDLKEGKIVSLSKMLAVNQIFIDSKKGDRASDSDIQQIFGTLDIEKIAEVIVKKGEIQLTTEFRKKKAEEKKKQIAAFISKFGVNPQTKVPHPQERIVNAMNQARCHVDPFKPADQQVDSVLKQIQGILPISMEEAILDIEIPAQYSGQAFGVLKELGSLENQKWLNDGSLHARLKIPAGLKEKVFSKLNAMTGGNVKITER